MIYLSLAELLHVAEWTLGLDYAVRDLRLLEGNSLSAITGRVAVVMFLDNGTGWSSASTSDDTAAH